MSLHGRAGGEDRRAQPEGPSEAARGELSAGTRPHAPTNEVLLRAQELGLRQDGRALVEGVAFDLHAGEWTALVGPNGAGKSTLLMLLAGLRPPSQGVVEWRGRALAAWPPRERAAQIAWLGQGGGEGAGEGEIAARDAVALGRLPRHGLLGSPDAADDAAVRAAMAETETGAFAARRLSALSGGERQRVLLARALAVQPRLFLLDEPASYLDAPHQRALLAGLAARARAGAAVLSVMHDVGAALTADRVLVMQGGRLVADGRPGDVRLRQQLVEVFGGAFSIECVHVRGRDRWVVVPVL